MVGKFLGLANSAKIIAIRRHNNANLHDFRTFAIHQREMI